MTCGPADFVALELASYNLRGAILPAVLGLVNNKSPPPSQQTAPAPAGGSEITTQLNQLAQLHASGVFSGEEFAEAKQKVLAGG